MAASQARHIELCARKTNVEYEGQQINQQRTALANESAGLFNKMLQLQVPTAPNYNQYVKTIYSFNDGTNEYTIDSIATDSTNPSYNCKVNFYSTEEQYTGLYKERSDLEIHQIGDEIYYGTKKLDKYDAKTDEAAVRQIYLDTYLETKDHPTMDDHMAPSFVGQNYATSINPDVSPEEQAAALAKIYKYSTGGNTYYVSLDNAKSTKFIDQIDKIDTASNVTTIKRYYDDGTGGMGKLYKTYTRAFKTGDTVGDTTPVTDYVTNNPVQNCYANDLTVKNWQEGVEAYIDKDDSGNYARITLENYSNTFDLKVFQETDDVAYNQAMNDYVYQKSVYDKNIADLNAKTEIIQQEDRTLELKLKQLDTEHNALQTEIDAVKKVCDKNVEDTFKTFG